MSSGPQEPERLSREDAARWHMATPKNPMIIGALLLFEQRLTLESLDELVVGKIIPHRRFRQHVVECKQLWGRPWWRDDAAFTLRDHVQKLSPSHVVNVDELIRLANERMNAPLPADRSPWRLELIDLAPTGSALLLRIHHCIADGRALVALLNELADDLGKPEPGAARRPPSPSLARRRRFFGRVAGLLRFLSLSRDPVSLLRRSLGGHKRIAWSAAIPLDAVKSIAHAGGHQFVDVLLAAVAGALHRYQREHGQLPRSMRALLPVAPPASSTHGLGNHFASVFVRLPVTSADPKTRLVIVARDMVALRSRSTLRMALSLVRLAGAIAPAIEHWAVRWWSRRASLVVSSLAGPTVPLHVAGRALRTIVVWAPAAASIGLSLTFFGYAGNLHLGVLADEAVIERPEELVTAFQVALDDLRRSALPDNH
ncbi:MAG TPA: WS/DGAT domain-containing protein [Polyangia bacterium]|jgi:diacylglycerol O-acyltransferase|nr:WS/DGAT domain-containing protein [Polyangia bacterium]